MSILVNGFQLIELTFENVFFKLICNTVIFKTTYLEKTGMGRMKSPAVTYKRDSTANVMHSFLTLSKVLGVNDDFSLLLGASHDEIFTT